MNEDEMRDALLVFAQHLRKPIKCQFLRSRGYAPCNCGYVELQKVLDVKTYERANAYDEQCHKNALATQEAE